MGILFGMSADRPRPNQPSREMYSIATRTLLASGYRITSADTHPRHIEFDCERPSRFGAMLRFRTAFTIDSHFDETTIRAVHRTAAAIGRAAVLVSTDGGLGQVSWAEFVAVLGGAVPSWRALSQGYSKALETAAKNKNPLGMSGEAWAIFEDLVADGLEFCFGRKVGRFGGRRRGLRVSDMIAQLPDTSLLVIDAKAYESGIRVTWPVLRPLAEYVNKQKEYQQGRNEIVGALLVSSAFQQDMTALLRPSADFLGETRVPLCFMTAATLAKTIRSLTEAPDLRNSIRWKLAFTGGLITTARIVKELRRTKQERFESGVD
jgi:hypothetical protein